jgi:hypothetical protein
MSPNSSISTSERRRRDALRTVSWTVFGVVLAVIVLEGFLRLLPVPRGVYGADPDSSWPLHRLVPNSTYTYSMGWDLHNVNRGRINAQGYVADRDYDEGSHAVVVVGDSYIESLMNPFASTLQGRVGELIGPGLGVVHFGVSGASMADYLAAGPVVRGHYVPEWLVVLISKGDYLEGFTAGPDYYRWDEGSEALVTHVPATLKTPLEKWLRDLAVVRYVRGNLKFSPLEFIRPKRVDVPANPGACMPMTLAARDDVVLRRYVQLLPSRYGLPPERVIMLFDLPERATLYSARKAPAPCDTRETLSRRQLMDLSLAAGMHVIDLGPAFAEAVRGKRRRVDYLPLDGHWNALGHEVAAEEVAAVINPGRSGR